MYRTETCAILRLAPNPFRTRVSSGIRVHDVYGQQKLSQELTGIRDLVGMSEHLGHEKTKSAEKKIAADSDLVTLNDSPASPKVVWSSHITGSVPRQVLEHQAPLTRPLAAMKRACSTRSRWMRPSDGTTSSCKGQRKESTFGSKNPLPLAVRAA